MFTAAPFSYSHGREVEAVGFTPPPTWPWAGSGTAVSCCLSRLGSTDTRTSAATECFTDLRPAVAFGRLELELQGHQGARTCLL